jgi:hypothetical protein
MSYYSDDEDIDIRVERRRSSPVHYVDVPAYQQRRPRQYYPTDHSPSYLEPERTTIVATRSASRDRSRERMSSPVVPQVAPVVINNRIYNEYSSDEEESHHRFQLSRPRHRSRSRSRSQSGAKELKEEADLRRAKEELDGIKRRQAQAEEEARIKKELELKRLKEEEREAEEQKRRDKAAEEAVNRYKKQEMERIRREKEEESLREKEFKHRLQGQLIQSGLDEAQIAAILKNEKVPERKEEKPSPKYTRMARKHLSLETLRTFDVEYFVDDQVC